MYHQCQQFLPSLEERVAFEIETIKHQDNLVLDNKDLIKYKVKLIYLKLKNYIDFNMNIFFKFMNQFNII